MSGFALRRLSALFIASAMLAACSDDDKNEDTTPPAPPVVDPAPTPDPVTDAGLRVAFISDVHFHDIYGDFQDGSFPGLPNAASGENATIRTMYASLTSTRLFNENYFAFLAALDDAVAKKVNLVVLPGDFSDDGQPVHMRGLKAIMDRYTTEHGVKFLVTFGNHDPVRPFTRAAGKSDYLGVDGKTQRIFSRSAVTECNGYTGEWTTAPSAGADLPTVCTEEVREQGYRELMEDMRSYGAYPKRSDVYWESPYSSYTAAAQYTYDKAASESVFANRQYEICRQGTGGSYKQADYTQCLPVPDASYLAEPIEGVWVLSLDSNVYTPVAGANIAELENGSNFDGSGNAGWNAMITHKQHVVAWAADVAKRAKEQGKQLITFGHYPMTPFYKDTDAQVAQLFGERGLDLRRVPTPAATAAAAATGVQLHFGGHLHTNDTGVFESGSDYLVNVQVPSLAAYVPAYKLATYADDGRVDIDTVVLRDVPRFNELFEHYAVEHDYLSTQPGATLWNRDALNSKNYREFASWHITELTRLRFLGSNWSCEMRTVVQNLNAQQLLILSVLDSSVTLAQLRDFGGFPVDLSACTTAGATPAAASGATQFYADYEAARSAASVLASAQGITLESLADVSGITVAADFHRLLNAGELAFEDLQSRAGLYRALNAALKDSTVTVLRTGTGSLSDQNDIGTVFQASFKPMYEAMAKAASAKPNLHFVVDPAARTLTDRSGNRLNLQ